MLNKLVLLTVKSFELFLNKDKPVKQRVESISKMPEKILMIIAEYL